jgi:hypothetical protein
MKSITISVSNPNKEFWSLVKLFAEDVFGKKHVEQKSFQRLWEVSIDIKLETLKNEVVSFQEKGDVISFNAIIDSTAAQPEIIIKYIKRDARRDFSELIPFFYIAQYVNILLYIDISNVADKESRDRYYFSCSQFFYYIKEDENLKAKNHIHIIDRKEDADIETGEVKEYIYAKRLAQKLDYNLTTIFSPLIEITEANKQLLFEKKATDNSDHYLLKHIREQVNKKVSVSLKRELNKIDYKNSFSEIFIKSLLIHLDTKNIYFSLRQNLNGNLSLLNSYCDNIKELVENVIFHTTEKKGFIFFAFNKFSDISDDKKKYFENRENKILRLIEICIYDFNEIGILDTFSKTKKDQISLKDFFDIDSIITTDLTHLELRYAAHLGLKSFAKSIVKNEGYFYLETNNPLKKEEKLALNYHIDDKTGYHIESFNTNKYFINGTHYEILLPFSPALVMPIQNSLVSYQAKSFVEIYKKWLSEPKSPQIKTVSIQQLMTRGEFPNITNKDEQINFIKEIGNRILDIHSDRGIIAFDYKEFPTFIDNNLLFKILAFIQLKSKDYFEVIVLHNANEAFIESIKEITQMLLPNNADIWNDNAVLVLITKDLNYYIIGGKTGKQVNEYNRLARLYYPIGTDNIGFHFSDDTRKDVSKIKIEYILPYDLLIKDDGFIFEKYVAEVLENDIEDMKIGYKLSSNYTKLGSKIITKNFFEADTLFQNSFFVDRFAYLVSKQLSESLQGIKKRIVIIGYGQYSELLLNTIKRIFRDKEIHAFVIAKDVNNDIDWSFESNTKDDICKNANDFLYAVIVPIGSTTTTNDKIIAKFKQYIASICQNEIDDAQFIYSCSAILVRDRDNSVDTRTKISNAEHKINWKSISDKIVVTSFGNRENNTHFIVSKNGEWAFPINSTISFPHNFWEEESINLTKSSSLNSQRLIGFPKVKEIQRSVFNETLVRLNDLKDFISAGHIKKEKSHHRYYIDTERFVKSSSKSYLKWLEDVKKILNGRKGQLHLLVTPSTNIESDLIKTINEKVFDNTGLIIYIDIEEDYRNNIVHKYSFLKTFVGKNNICIHFIDHALLTGESAKKARSYISSIFGDNKPFDSVITLVNRLSYDRDREINGYKEKDIINSYITLFVPPSKDPEKDCSICAAIKHYENNIIKQSSLDSCHFTVKRKVYKIQEKEYDKDGNKELSSREFDRFALTHQIFYEISELVHKGESKDKIIYKLGEIFSAQKSKGDEDRITFVKVLSSHPLNHYMHIKDYIHSLLLLELKEILSKKENPKILEFKYLLVIIKQLSELGSNALIRNKVIIDVWEFYFNLRQKNRDKEEIEKIHENIQIQENSIKSINEKISIKENDILSEERQQGELPFVINELRQELKDLKIELQKHHKEKDHLIKGETTLKYNINNFKDLFALYIKNITYNDESKSFWLGELLRQGVENIDFENPTTSPNRENNPIFVHFNGFSNNLEECYKESIKDELKLRDEVLVKENIEQDIHFLRPIFFIDDKLQGYKDIKRQETYELLNEILTKYCATIKMPEVKKVTNTLYSKLDELNRYYKDFLMQVFYDNTTIIRKTIENFENEIIKNKYLRLEFFNGNNLTPYEHLNKSRIENLLRHIVSSEYYYRNAKEYIESRYNAGLFENLIDLLYIKLLTSSYQDKEIRSNEIIKKITPILEIFSNIMGADEAQLIIADSGTDFTKNTKFYNITQYGKDVNKKQEIQTVKEGSYVYRTLRKGQWTYPLVVQNDISKFDEGKLGYKSLNMLMIYEPPTEESQSTKTQNISSPVGCISFLYRNEIPKIASQEKGRLILIVRSLINEYIDSLLNRTIVNDWIEKTLNQQKFDVIYNESAHYQNRYVYPAINEVEEIIKKIKTDKSLINELCKTYYVLSNIIITGIYSHIERNAEIGRLGEENDNKVSGIFNEQFLNVLKVMASRMFKQGGSIEIINNADANAETRYNKFVLQSFVIQCIHNSMRKHLPTFDKTTTITINNDEIVIQNNFSSRVGYAEEIKRKKNLFEIVKPSIVNLRCEEYSCTTLTSIQGYSKEIGCSCDFIFDNNCFTVSIKL